MALSASSLALSAAANAAFASAASLAGASSVSRCSSLVVRRLGCVGFGLSLPLRAVVSTAVVAPKSPKPDHCSALASRPSRSATSGSATAACSVDVTSSRSVADGFVTSAPSNAARTSSSTRDRCSADNSRMAAPSIAACAARSRSPISVSECLTSSLLPTSRLTTQAAVVGLRAAEIRFAAAASPRFLAAAASFVRSAVNSSGLTA